MFLERDTEVERLHRLLSDIDSLGGRVVLVRGEAGIGKSALISQFIDRVRDDVHLLVGMCDDLLTPQPLSPDHPAHLTGRQAEALDLLAEGLSNHEIADRLFISTHTAENHVAAILMKLDATDRHAAVDVARTPGLVA